MKKRKEISEDIQVALGEVIKHFEQEDRYVRERQIRLWKKLEYTWSGFSRLWWDEVAHDWKAIGEDGQDSFSQDASFYDKPINVFKAFLESIIAAATSAVPVPRCVPDDADNPNDLATAKGGNDIAKLVYKHIDAPLLFMKAWWIYCIQGMVASYRYTDTDEKYGTFEVSNYEDAKEEQETKICSICGQEITDQDLALSEQMDETELNEFQPEEHDAEIHEKVQEAEGKGEVVCPNCLSQMVPELQKKQVTVTRFVGITQEPKSRQCIEILGGLYVKVPNYAKCQADIPYLAYCYETHYANVLKQYPHMREKLGAKVRSGSTSGALYDPYERWGRLNTQYFGEYPLNTPTVGNWWLRPCAFEVLSDDDVREKLYKKYPDGVKVVKINDEFCDAENDSLDDHWTLTVNPLSEYIHFDPHGMMLTPIQEITNDLISLVLQTIEHGIPQTFADPEVLNFEQYRQTEAAPGSIIPVRPKPGKAIGESFYEVKTATLSQEIQPFSDKIQELGQFISGALPSLWGGNQEGSSRTAAQYAMSRAQSLQRLQIAWKMLTHFWKNTFAKVIPAYIKDMQEEEHYAEEQTPGNFISVVIRKADLQGKIGSIELEASEQLPFTWAQKRDVLMNLLQSANPAIIQVLTSPENAHFLSEALGLDEIYIPGEDDRQKQYEEIQALLKANPIPAGTNQNGQPQEGPSVDVELFVDNHGIEATICRGWLVSEAGRLAKVENPDGYKNVLLHLKKHIDAMKFMGAQMGAPQGPPQGQQANPNQNKPMMAAPQSGQGVTTNG
jgi:hypothetical protein